MGLFCLTWDHFLWMFAPMPLQLPSVAWIKSVVCTVQAPGPWCDRGQDVRGPISGGAHHLCSWYPVPITTNVLTHISAGSEALLSGGGCHSTWFARVPQTNERETVANTRNWAEQNTNNSDMKLGKTKIKASVKRFKCPTCSPITISSKHAGMFSLWFSLLLPGCFLLRLGSSFCWLKTLFASVKWPWKSNTALIAHLLDPSTLYFHLFMTTSRKELHIA